MKLSAGSVRDAISHCLESTTSLENANARLNELGIDAGQIPGLVDALDRGAGMEWGGSAAATLGLEGNATGAELASLLTSNKISNRSVDISARGGGGTGAFGLVRAEDKTVSILLASPDENVREAAMQAHRAGNAAYIETLESLLRTRAGKDGVRSLPVKGMLCATVEHYSSSHGEPTLHSHILISKMVECEDGKFRSIDGNTLFSLTAVAESAAQAAIYKNLNENIDAKLSFRDVGSASIVEIPELRTAADQLCTAKRRVDETLEEMGRLFGPRWKESRDAWRKYRAQRGEIAEQIEHAVDNALRTNEGGEQVRKMWAERAPALEHALRGVSPAPAGQTPAASVDVGEANYSAQCPKVQAIKEEVWAWACDRETVRFSDLHAKMTARLGVKNAGIAAFELLSHAQVEQGVDLKKARSAVIASLTKRETATSDFQAIAGGCSKFTTAPAIARAENVIAQAKRSMNESGCRLTPKIPETATPDQVEAIGKMTAGRQLSIVTGVAGAGKTFSVAPVAAAAQDNGLAVLSIARNAARALETGEGISADKSQSLAAFRQKGPPKGPCLIVLDEGGVVDRDDYIYLLNLLDERPDVQLIALGDARQAQSIDRLDTWTLLESAGKETGSHAELTASRRTAAWTDEHNHIRNCEAAPELLNNICNENRITAVTEHTFAIEAARLIADEPDATAIVQTNAEAAEISRIVQNQRGIAGVLPCSGDNLAGVGDIVRTRQNDHKRGVFNGDVWTVEGITEENVFLKAASGKTAVIGHDYAAEALELGYASTLDSAQGITVKRAVVVVGEGMGNTGLYSATTRGKQPPHYLCMTPDLSRHTKSDVAREKAKSALRRAISTDDKAENALTFSQPPETPEAPSWGTPSEIERRAEKKAQRLAELERERQIERERERARQREREREVELRQRYRDPSFTAPKPRSPSASTPTRNRSRGMEM